MLASEQSELLLLESIRNGNYAAFETLFKRYYKHLCSYANQIIVDLDSSEEIVQEFFYQLWQKKDSIFVKTSAKSYLFRAIHNACMNHIKFNKIRASYVQSNLQNENSLIEGSYQIDGLNELQKQIAFYIEKLPPERKKVFTMIRLEGKKYKEVAETLNISVKTVENQMGKAMQFLRESLKDYLPIFYILFLNLVNFFTHGHR